MSILKNCCDFRHRYAILVDNIFFSKRKKSHHQENIDKLTFYVISSPEKLDRIASRLYNHLVSFIRSNKDNMVILASEVMNQLLDASPPSFINLMMDDYFKMIVKLLCHDSTEYQIISSKSFRKFANINANTPILQEYFSILVAQFVRLCCTKHGDMHTILKLRIAGLVGIQALILKTKDAVTHNVWNTEAASQIIPALLQNLTSIADPAESENVPIPLSDEILPYFNEFVNCSSQTALSNTNSEALSALMSPFSCSHMLLSIYCLRELLQSSTISNAEAIVLPIYQYWSDNNLWVYPNPSSRMIELISYSLNPQLEHIPIRLLFDEIRKQKSQSKVLSIIKILPSFGGRHSGPSLGHIYFEILTLLVVSLKESCSFQSCDTSYFDAILATIDLLVGKLPSFQKSEAYQMMLNHMPNFRKHKKSIKKTSEKLSLSDRQVQECTLLMSCLERTSTLYSTDKIQAVLNLVFLEQLSNCIFFPIPDFKLNVIKTFNHLIDQHKNHQYILQYLSSGNIEDVVIPDNDLRDISIKKLLKVAESLITGTFCSDSSIEVVRELSIFLCIFCLEANLNNFTQSLCMILVSVGLVDTFQSNLSNLYQSLIFTVINLISFVSKNSRLVDLCGRVKAARVAVNPSFWMPSELLEPTTYTTTHDLKSDVFFDQKHIEKSFNSNNLTPTFQSETDDKGSTIFSTESDNLSIDSGHSNIGDINLAAQIKTSFIGNLGFMRRDKSGTNSIALEDIEKNYRKSEMSSHSYMPPKMGEKLEDSEYFS